MYLCSRNIYQDVSSSPEFGQSLRIRLNRTLEHLAILQGKGQLISECLFHVLNFPKKQQKN